MAKNTYVNKEGYDRLKTARVKGLIVSNPFWSYISSQLALVEAHAEIDPIMASKITTLATNGKQILWNNDFVCKLSTEELIFVDFHEVAHVVFDHCGKYCRCNGHDHVMSDIAADFVVNNFGVKANIGKMPGTDPSKSVDQQLDRVLTHADLVNGNLPKKGEPSRFLYDPKFDGMSYEQVYEIIMKDEKAIKENIGGSGNSGDFLLDQHAWDELTDEQKEEIRQFVKEASVAASIMYGRDKLPEGIARMVGELLDPKITWKDVLTLSLESQMKNRTTYTKLGRRTFSSPFIYPSFLKEPKVNVTIGFDLSGSIGQEQCRAFFSEVVGLLQQFSSYEIGVFCWDTQVHNYQTFDDSNIDELPNYQLVGGGGTDFSCAFDFFKKEDITPEQLICFTDGEIGDWGDPDYCKTMFIIYNQRKGIVAPYGQTFDYLDE